MPFARAQRLDQLPPYLFIEIDRLKSEALAAGRDVISFGVGDPDQPTPTFIVEAMAAAVHKTEYHPYPSGAGMLAYRQACAAFAKNRFGIDVNPKGEVMALIGSKEGIGHLPLAVINPGDVALIPSPGYPVYESSTIFAGGTPYTMPLTAENGFLPNFDAIPADVLNKARLMFINYPNNPTGATATLEFFERCVALARQHDFVICSDAAYSEMYFDETAKPHSILEVDGAKDVAIEMHSLSKTFNMTGWRVGFALGNADVLAALAKIKGNVDSGVFGAIQEASIAALARVDGREIESLRAMYQQRAETLVTGLKRAGFVVDMPKATFYVWAQVPKGFDSMLAAKRILEEADIVAIPGVGFGKAGDQYVRFALTVDQSRIAEAVKRLEGMSW